MSIANNTGCYIDTAFSGTGIAASFDLTRNTSTLPQISWSIDGGAISSPVSIASTVTIASGLSAGNHTLRLYTKSMGDPNNERWNPPIVDAVYFVGFAVTGGTIALPPVSTKKRIQYFGDSITEGLWIYGAPPNTPADFADGPNAWPAQIARGLGCDWRQTAFGGTGLAAGGTGNAPAAGNSLGYVYAGTPDDNEQPDIVVLNYGANDISVPPATYLTAVGAYLTAVRAKYPSATIVQVRAYGGAQEFVTLAALRAFAPGDGNTLYVDTSGYGLVSGDYNAGHPNVTGTTKIVTQLQPTLSNILTPTTTWISFLSATSGGWASQSFSIFGVGLSGATSVTIGGVSCAITANTARMITVTTPAKTANTTAQDVVLTLPSGTITLAAAYTFLWQPTDSVSVALGGVWFNADAGVTTVSTHVTAWVDGSGNGWNAAGAGTWTVV
ncbi:MAG: GDSL-type esterase/lipase family protein, partial [Polyangiaceae bacterium]